MRIEISSALIAMTKLEKWLSGRKRLSTWAQMCLEVHKRIPLREILLDSEE